MANLASPLKPHTGDDTDVNVRALIDHARIEHPADLLRQKLADGDVPLETIRYHMRAAFSLLFRSNRNDRASLAREKPIVREVLHYLWTRNERWLAFLQDFRAKDSLTFLAAAEGHDDLITQWLEIAMPDQAEIGISLSAMRTRAWRGSLMRSYIRALHSTALDRSADSAIGFFLHMRERCCLTWEQVAADAYEVASKRYPLLALSTWPAAIELKGRLTSCDAFGTDAKLFEEFTAVFQRLEETAGRRGELDWGDFGVGRLHMAHPTKPDPSLAIAYFRTILDETPTNMRRNILPAQSTPQWRGLRHAFARALQLAQQQNHQDAAWLEQMERDLFPSDPMTLTQHGSISQRPARVKQHDTSGGRPTRPVIIRKVLRY
ncbi:hypothetical protein LTR78_010158 [Recurvomyces mirabilis]|uniref:Uncharacterized protein n=1 Tax=Recurvomyces mirabilis TaxID=574656 RepID=A0AAE0TQ81_9PEZI|nr:hypothetical protein LTR78_010158 [Recurvomyces mirabilis]KAK5149949.1 hypothetical protein LTS14_010554 [Recurvomyces mirabilis]